MFGMNCMTKVIKGKTMRQNTQEQNPANQWAERLDDTDTKPETDVRSEWERDYSRIIHSVAFRRLQAKTQVLGLGESDFYRTRLTHSMEVAQIGIGILKSLKHRYNPENNSEPNASEIYNALPESALMGTICLAHDIGHPPFGHGGEIALNICMRDFGGFEGNGQTLRILSRLAHYSEENGLNPTRRTLLGVLKYPANYSRTVNESFYQELKTPIWLSKSKEQKPPKCYLDSESDIVDWILEPLNEFERKEFTKVSKDKANHFRPKYKSLDASIMELADDISYTLHDLEDAVALKLITPTDWDNYFQDEQTYKDLKKSHGKKIDCNSIFKTCHLDYDKVKEELFSEKSYIRKKIIGKLVHILISNTQVVEISDKFTTSLIRWNAKIKEEYEYLRKLIFNLVMTKVIKSSNVQQLEFKGQKIVIELFQAIDSDPERLLPEKTRMQLENIKSNYGSLDIQEYKKHRARLICDYIAGMTDDYAARLYEKIYYPHKGSVFDRM